MEMVKIVDNLYVNPLNVCYVRTGESLDFGGRVATMIGFGPKFRSSVYEIHNSEIETTVPVQQVVEAINEGLKGHRNET